MTASDVFPGQPESSYESASSLSDEEVFFFDVSDDALERTAMGYGAAAYTGFYGPWSPCTSVGLPCG
ncbi:MAG TPA: hypothetical protein VH678_06895 [Xanthobacteraceae bacterium]|jgi:hypothetical protein